MGVWNNWTRRTSYCVSGQPGGANGPLCAIARVEKAYAAREGEQRVLEQMRAMHAQGMGYTRIAELLNGEGIRTRYGKP
jgi:hypothetical protein